VVILFSYLYIYQKILSFIYIRETGSTPPSSREFDDEQNKPMKVFVKKLGQNGLLASLYSMGGHDGADAGLALIRRLDGSDPPSCRPFHPTTKQQEKTNERYDEETDRGLHTSKCTESLWYGAAGVKRHTMLVGAFTGDCPPRNQLISRGDEERRSIFDRIYRISSCGTIAGNNCPPAWVRW